MIFQPRLFTTDDQHTARVGLQIVHRRNIGDDVVRLADQRQVVGAIIVNRVGINAENDDVIIGAADKQVGLPVDFREGPSIDVPQACLARADQVARQIVALRVCFSCACLIIATRVLESQLARATERPKRNTVVITARDNKGFARTVGKAFQKRRGLCVAVVQIVFAGKRTVVFNIGLGQGPVCVDLIRDQGVAKTTGQGQQIRLAVHLGDGQFLNFCHARQRGLSGQITTKRNLRDTDRVVEFSGRVHIGQAIAQRDRGQSLDIVVANRIGGLGDRVDLVADHLPVGGGGRVVIDLIGCNPVRNRRAFGRDQDQIAIGQSDQLDRADVPRLGRACILNVVGIYKVQVAVDRSIRHITVDRVVAQPAIDRVIAACGFDIIGAVIPDDGIRACIDLIAIRVAVTGLDGIIAGRAVDHAIRVLSR